MPNVMAALPNISGALCDSSVIPFLVPHRNLWLTPIARKPYRNAANIGERNGYGQLLVLDELSVLFNMS